jgi:hypothetical protein
MATPIELDEILAIQIARSSSAICQHNSYNPQSDRT